MSRPRLSRTGLALVSLAGLSLAACGTQLQEAQQTLSQGTAFQRSLYAGYLALAQSEYDSGDYRDSDAFAQRAIRAAKGEGVAPEPVARRDLAGGAARDRLIRSRARLLAAFETGAAERTPDKAAQAQTLYDCWLEEQEENRQPDAIAACRDGLLSLLAALEDDAAGIAEAEAEARRKERLAQASGALSERPAPPAPVKTEGPTALGTYIVFFELNRIRLTEDTKQILLEVVRAAKEATSMRIRAIGHADMVGRAHVNEKLARKRAEAVARFLIDNGVDALRVSVESLGESEPLIPTGDEVAEVQNRRVEIRFEPTPDIEGVPVASLDLEGEM